MRKGWVTVLCAAIAVMSVACASSQKTGFTPGEKDIQVDIRDATWNFGGLGTVYLYTDTVNSQEEKDAVAEMVTLLSARGARCVVDTGESIVYENSTLQVRTHRKLMSLLTSIYLLKPGIKGNEEIIVVISADNPLKAAAETARYIDVMRAGGTQ